MQRDNHDKRTDLYDKAVHFTAFDDYEDDWQPSSAKSSRAYSDDYDNEPEPEYHTCATCGRMADDYETMPAVTEKHTNGVRVMRDEKGEVVRKCNNCRAAGE
jgi:hypothetical protein